MWRCASPSCPIFRGPHHWQSLCQLANNRWHCYLLLGCSKCLFHFFFVCFNSCLWLKHCSDERQWIGIYRSSEFSVADKSPNFHVPFFCWAHRTTAPARCDRPTGRAKKKMCVHRFGIECHATMVRTSRDIRVAVGIQPPFFPLSYISCIPFFLVGVTLFRSTNGTQISEHRTMLFPATSTQRWFSLLLWLFFRYINGLIWTATWHHVLALHSNCACRRLTRTECFDFIAYL